MDLAMDLISEFVFCEKNKDIDSRKPYTVTSSLNVIQEFQLVFVLCEFFARPGQDATRNAVFLSLFGGSITQPRTSVLVKLISTSVSASIAPLLSSAGCWMQQLGCTSEPSLELARNLVKDFVTFAKKASEQLKTLPMLAPRFSANFMTAVTDLYLNEAKGEILAPPEMLLEVFTDWVSENPSLCLASQEPLALPVGAIAMPVIPPLAGLIRWCVLAPLSTTKCCYSKLHLSILQSLQQTPQTNGPPTALNVQHLGLTINSLLLQVELLRKNNRNPENDEMMQMSLERFAQAVQVALASRCIYGSTAQLLCRLETLPHNPLMEIVIKANK